MRAHGLLGLLLVSATACAQILGVTDWQSGDSAGAGSAVGGAAGSGGGSVSAGGATVGPACGPADCPGCACVGAPPVGWSGPVSLITGAVDAAAPCPGESVEIAHAGAGPSLPPPACSACTCTGGAVPCGVDSVDLYPQPGCSGTITTVSSPPPGCSAAGGMMDFAGVIASAPAPLATCPESGVAQTAPAPSFTGDARLCSELGAGSCGADQVCASAALRCIHAPGELPCPDAAMERTVLYASLSDTRSCTPCTCTVNGNPCRGSGSLYDSVTCNGVVATTFALDGQCNSLPSSPQGYAGLFMNIPASFATCTPGGGAAIGEAKAEMATTVCCMP